jgi:putative membrane-bound dehydrogenase-like protein
VVSCHTHFRPSSYQGPEFDEILVFDSEGKNRRVFYNKTKTTMQLLWGADGWLYVAQRDRILRVKDSDNDGVGDTEETIAGLDTLADYPHNGLSGMTWHTDGGLIFSLGENFGKDWTLRGSDGKSLVGRGEGGVFHCTKAGGDIRRIAKGFWNPFGLWMRNDGVLFAAENDPGSRPPCRLLHVVQGGDYGFQYVYGSTPVHPFVCWEGQLRGTLGMIHPSGEGPCAVVGLGGGVMIPSWSNHCIDYYPLRWQGATLQAQRIELIRGSDMFRPTGMVRKNDREYYFADWVSPSYELHGMGRLWKLTIDPDRADWLVKESQEWTPEAQLAERLQLEIDNLLPIVDAAVLLGFAKVTQGDISLTEIGIDFATTTILRSKDLFRQQILSHVPIIDSMVQSLREKQNGSMRGDFFLDIVECILLSLFVFRLLPSHIL